MTSGQAQPTAAPKADMPRTDTLPANAPVLESQALLQGQCSVLIRHHNELYRLQLTRQGKLILTK